MSAPTETPSNALDEIAEGPPLTDEQFEADSWDEGDPDDKVLADLQAFIDDDDVEDDDDDAIEDADDPEAAPKKKAAPAQKPAAEKPETKPKEAAKPDPKAATDEKPAEPKTYRAKLGDEERELSAEKLSRALGVPEEVLASMDEGAAVRAYQKIWNAERAQDSASRATKQVEQFLARIKGDPINGLKALLSHEDIGVDVKQVAQDILSNEFAMLSMTPEQRAAHEAKAELEALKREHAEAQAAAEQEAEQRRRQEFAATLTRDINAALDGASIPANTRMRQRIVSMMQREAQERAGQDPSGLPPAKQPTELIAPLRTEMQEDLRTFTEGMDADAFAEFIGPERVKAIEQRAVRKYARRRPVEEIEDERPEPTRRREPKRPMSFDEAIERAAKSVRTRW